MFIFVFVVIVGGIVIISCVFKIVIFGISLFKKSGYLIFVVGLVIMVVVVIFEFVLLVVGIVIKVLILIFFKCLVK